MKFIGAANELPQVKQDYFKHYYYLDIDDNKVELPKFAAILVDNKPYVLVEDTWMPFKYVDTFLRAEKVGLLEEKFKLMEIRDIAEYVVDKFVDIYGDDNI